MNPRNKVFAILFSPLINFFHKTLHISFIWIIFLLLIIFTIILYIDPKWSISRCYNFIDKIIIIFLKIISVIVCFGGMILSLHTQFIDPIWKQDIGDEVLKDVKNNRIGFLLYFLVSSFGAYRVFYNGIFLPAKKKKYVDKKVKIDIMSIVYFVMLAIFAITSLLVVLGVIKV